MQTRIGVIQRSCSTLHRIAGSGLLGETGYPDREVIDNSGRALMIERDQRPVVAEANNSERFVLANQREAEHLLIKID